MYNRRLGKNIDGGLFVKKYSLILCVLIALLVAVSGCSVSSDDGKQATKKDKEKQTRTVVDHLGAKVVVPAKIERVVITTIWPLPSVYALYQGSGAKIVGMHPASKSAAENSLLIKLAPEIADAETNFIQGNEVNTEELLKLKPDVVFCSTANQKEYDALKQTGIPVVAFSPMLSNYNAVETVNKWLMLLGDVFGEENKIPGITEYGKNVEAKLDEKLKDVPDDQKPKALVLFQYRDTVLQTVGKNHFGQYWLDSTGAINVTGDVDKAAMDINMEQIYELNPDIIYITNFSPYQPEDFYNNSIEGYDWSNVKAVADKKVYKFPLGTYRWYPVSADAPLVLLWMAQLNQPELFADIDLEAEVKDYYKKYFDYSLTDQELEKLFNPPSEAADGV